MLEAIFNQTACNKIIFIPAEYNRCSVKNCVFIHLVHYVYRGGAILIDQDLSSLQITHSLFSMCKANARGGGIYVEGNVSSNISYNSFIDCKSNLGLSAYFFWWTC